MHCVYHNIYLLVCAVVHGIVYGIMWFYNQATDQILWEFQEEMII